MIFVLLAPVIAVVAVTLFDLVLRPGFRRQAFRNLARRKGEAALVVLGSLLGTAIITSSLIVGDTLDASIRDLARTQLGPIDEVVLVDDAARVGDVVAAAEADPVPGTDGVLGLVSAPATATTRGDAARAEPDAYVHELDFAAARAFGGDPSVTGFDNALATPGPGSAVISRDLADELDVAVDDRVDLHLYGAVMEVEVTGIVPRIGVAGFNPGSAANSPAAF